jgi:carbon monoxide dehydrogenase subunit G
MRSFVRPLLAALLIAFLPHCAWPATAADGVVVDVRKEGAEVAVDVDCPVDAPREVVWDVLTDYDHMAQFISNLDYSGIDARTDNVLRVHQKGKVSRGILSLSFDNVREIELLPRREIRSHMISGDMKASAFTSSTWGAISRTCGFRRSSAPPLSGRKHRSSLARSGRRSCAGAPRLPRRRNQWSGPAHAG